MVPVPIVQLCTDTLGIFWAGSFHDKKLPLQLHGFLRSSADSESILSAKIIMRLPINEPS